MERRWENELGGELRYPGAEKWLMEKYEDWLPALCIHTCDRARSPEETWTGKQGYRGRTVTYSLSGELPLPLLFSHSGLKHLKIFNCSC